MENQKLLNKVITISGEETKRTQYGLVKKIKDEAGLTYSIFDTKRDGSERGGVGAVQRPYYRRYGTD
jgi:hypothetical protein